MNSLTELRTAVVLKIFSLPHVDGLTGFTDAIAAVFPETRIQKCIIHQIRNSLKYVSFKDQKQFITDMKEVYKAPTEDKALFKLDKLEEKWSRKYSLAVKSWKENSGISVHIF